jgi:hypothetical protein
VKLDVKSAICWVYITPTFKHIVPFLIVLSLVTITIILVCDWGRPCLETPFQLKVNSIPATLKHWKRWIGEVDNLGAGLYLITVTHISRFKLCLSGRSGPKIHLHFRHHTTQHLLLAPAGLISCCNRTQTLECKIDWVKARKTSICSFLLAMQLNNSL